MAVGVVVGGGGVPGMVDDPVRPDQRRAYRHVVSDQVKPVPGVAGRYQVRQFPRGQHLAQWRGHRLARRRLGHQHIQALRTCPQREAGAAGQPQHAFMGQRKPLTGHRGRRDRRPGSRDHVGHRLAPAERDVVRLATSVQPPASDAQRDLLAEHVGAGPDPVCPPLVVADVGKIRGTDPRHARLLCQSGIGIGWITSPARTRRTRQRPLATVAVVVQRDPDYIRGEQDSEWGQVPTAGARASNPGEQPLAAARSPPDLVAIAAAQADWSPFDYQSCPHPLTSTAILGAASQRRQPSAISRTRLYRPRTQTTRRQW